MKPSGNRMSMDEILVCKSRRSQRNTTIVLFGIAFFIFLLFLTNHNQPNPVGREFYIKQVIIYLFTAIVIYCVFYLFNITRVKVFRDYLEVENLLKKQRIYFTEISKIDSQNIKARYNSWTNHYMILKSGKRVKLIEEEYSNFDEFYSLIKLKVSN